MLAASLKLRHDGSDPNWDFVHLIHCSKEAFRNLKRGWKRYQTPELVAKKASTDHRLKRKEEKSIQSKKNAVEIAQDFKLAQRFVRDMAHAEYQSDEVSGPESDSGESKEAWKVRLLGAAGYPTDHASVLCYNILEVLIPGWRVENYGKLLRESRRRNSEKHAQKYLCIYTELEEKKNPENTRGNFDDPACKVAQNCSGLLWEMHRQARCFRLQSYLELAWLAGE
ncbi:hypothetical protein B0H13DRAFT_2325922 [Mycena leptocephala]|nr:hypothetical protein B0H13DRAFT_2325922 [Mycena leptocephala]